MDFRRLDKYTVQCVMSEEEMNSFGLTIEDFINNKERTRGFLEHIVEMAGEEVDYHPEGGAVSMQIMRMPDNSLNIILSDQKNSGEGLESMLHYLHNIASMLENVTKGDSSNSLKDDSADEDDDAEIMEEEMDSEEVQKNLKEINEKANAYRTKMIKKKLSSPKLYRFNSLEEIEKFARCQAIDKTFPSTVYKDDATKSYYLFIKKGKLRLEEYLVICEKLREYSDFVSQEYYTEQYCKEHFKSYIKKQALKILRQYDL